MINPIVVEPVMQVMYEIKLKVEHKPDEPNVFKQYFLISPDGTLKEVQVNKP